MAITADVLLCFNMPKDQVPSSGSTNAIKISNVHAEKFPTREFEVPTAGEEVNIDASNHEWSNYFKAGFKGASTLLQKKHGKKFVAKAMNILVDGTVPAGGGLSSSAAFVCASALAVLRANGEEVVDKTELVELAIVSERAVGVNSGGYAMQLSLEGRAFADLDGSIAWIKRLRFFPSVIRLYKTSSTPHYRLIRFLFLRTSTLLLFSSLHNLS